MSIVRIHSKSGGASLSLGVGAIFVLVFSFCLFDLNPGRARAQSPSKVVVVTKDDTVIRESCIVRFHPGKVIRDKNGDGVLHIEADGITVEFERSSILRGAPAAQWRLDRINAEPHGQKLCARHHRRRIRAALAAGRHP